MHRELFPFFAQVVTCCVFVLFYVFIREEFLMWLSIYLFIFCCSCIFLLLLVSNGIHLSNVVFIHFLQTTLHNVGCVYVWFSFLRHVFGFVSSTEWLRVILVCFSISISASRFLLIFVLLALFLLALAVNFLPFKKISFTQLASRVQISS